MLNGLCRNACSYLHIDICISACMYIYIYIYIYICVCVCIYPQLTGMRSKWLRVVRNRHVPNGSKRFRTTDKRVRFQTAYIQAHGTDAAADLIWAESRNGSGYTFSPIRNTASAKHEAPISYGVSFSAVRLDLWTELRISFFVVAVGDEVALYNAKTHRFLQITDPGLQLGP